MAIINPNQMPHQIAVQYSGQTITKCVKAVNSRGGESFTVSTLSGRKETWEKKNGNWQPRK